MVDIMVLVFLEISNMFSTQTDLFGILKQHDLTDSSRKAGSTAVFVAYSASSSVCSTVSSLILQPTARC